MKDAAVVSLVVTSPAHAPLTLPLSHTSETLPAPASTSAVSSFRAIFCSSRHRRLYLLTAGVLVFFGLHNFLQELIMNLPGFKIGIFLGYLEILVSLPFSSSF
jgi:hypothetical protein